MLLMLFNNAENTVCYVLVAVDNLITDKNDIKSDFLQCQHKLSRYCDCRRILTQNGL